MTENDLQEPSRRSNLFTEQERESKFVKPENMNKNLVTYSKKIKLIKNCPQQQIESISRSLNKLQKLRHHQNQGFDPTVSFKNMTSDVDYIKLARHSKGGTLKDIGKLNKQYQ